jgi:hypothetical protein
MQRKLLLASFPPLRTFPKINTQQERNQQMKKIRPITQKLAQMQTMESIAVLVVFFFLIALGLRFYGQTQIQAFEELRAEFETLDSIKITNKLMSMPEMTCTRMNVQDVACFDYYKAKAWEKLGDRVIGLYLVEFGESTLTVEFLYPDSAASLPPIVIYNNTPTITSSQPYSRRTSFVPITVYKDRTYYFAILRIQQYTRAR